eukprot:SAG11_NODE_62_length_19006_cov_6.513143_24_plen_187_part_00
MEETLIYTQHYTNSITEVYLSEDNKTVTQKKCLYSSCGEYKYGIEEYLEKKMVGYRQIKKRVNKTNYVLGIDGTLCEDIPNEQFERMATAKPHHNAIETINKWYEEGNVITFFTSRKEEHREITEQWLRDNEVRWTNLIFGKPRIDGDVTAYHYIDNHKVRATRYKEESVWGDLVNTTKEIKIFPK